MKPYTRPTEFAQALPAQIIELPALSPTIGDPGHAVWMAIDTPPLVDAYRSEPGFYWGATGGANWRFAVLFESLDNGESWEEISHCTNKSIIGTVDDFSEHGLFVDVLDGELETISEGQLKFGGNTAYVLGGVIQFQEAELLAEKYYRLHGIVGKVGPQGPLATAPNFFLLSGYCVWHTERRRDLVGVPRLFKCLSEGQGLDDVDAVSWTNRSTWWNA